MRIVTRPDFDGIVCAVLIHEALKIDKAIYWVEPSEIQADKAKIKKGDIIANLPWHAECSLWFDHHVSNKPDIKFNGAFDIAPSAAGVVYNYYKGLGKLDSRFDELVLNTDMIDAADLTMDQVRFPEKHPYIILSMTIQNINFGDIPYWNRLVSMLRTMPIQAVLEDSEIRERCDQVIRENSEFSQHLKTHTTIHGQISFTDFSSLDPVPSGNRFLTYSVFPETIASIKIRYNNPSKTHVQMSIGRSIFNPGCNINIGRLLARYGGGGHAGAGGCTLDADTALEKIDEILEIMKANKQE